MNAAARLADHPALGRMVPEIGHNDIREIIVGKAYRLIYKHTPHCCYVLSVRHHRFNLSTLRSL